MRKILVLLLIGFVIVGLGAFVWISRAPTDGTSMVTELPAETPAANVPEGWGTYKSETLGYSISYPDSYALEPNGENSMLLLKPLEQPAVGPANFIYVSVVTPELRESEGTVYNYSPENFRKLKELEVGQSVVLSPPDQAEWFTYTRVDTIEIAGRTAGMFENTKPWEFPAGTTEVRYIFNTDENLYLLGYYYGGDGLTSPIDPREAFRIISTIQPK